MEKVEINGFIKSASNMDMNTFHIISESGAHLGDWYIVDSALLNKVLRNFKEYALATNQAVQSDEFVQSSVRLPVKFEVTARK